MTPPKLLADTLVWTSSANSCSTLAVTNGWNKMFPVVMLVTDANAQSAEHAVDVVDGDPGRGSPPRGPQR